MPTNDEHEVFVITFCGSTIENAIVALVLSGGKNLPACLESATACVRRPGDWNVGARYPVVDTNWNGRKAQSRMDRWPQ